MPTSKKLKDALAKVDRSKSYTLNDGLELVRSSATPNSPKL